MRCETSFDGDKYYFVRDEPRSVVVTQFDGNNIASDGFSHTHSFLVADQVTGINSTQATTYTEAITTYALGVKATPTVSAPADRTGGGREVTISAITDGTVSATGTAGFYALVDSSNTRLLAAAPLSATQSVTNGNTFTLTSFKIGIPDPA
jgi:hypothetical protein